MRANQTKEKKKEWIELDWGAEGDAFHRRDLEADGKVLVFTHVGFVGIDVLCPTIERLVDTVAESEGFLDWCSATY